MVRTAMTCVSLCVMLPTLAMSDISDAFRDRAVRDLPIPGQARLSWIPEDDATPVPAGTPAAPLRALASQEPTEPPRAAEPEAAIPSLGDGPRFKTSDVSPEAFPAMLAEATRLADATDASGRDILDLARIMIGGVFLPEAATRVRQITNGACDLTTREKAALHEMIVAIAVLDGPAISSGEACLGQTVRSAERRTGLWANLRKISQGGKPESQDLRSAVAELGDHSSPVARAVLPILFDGAIAAGDVQLARHILAAAVETGAVGDDSRRVYMEGRLAETEGDEQAAFDLYARAMAADGEDAAKARIAFSDIVLRRNVPDSMHGLRRILEEGISRSPAGESSRRMLIRLAAVTEETGDVEGAIRAVVRIAAQYPESEEGRLAAARLGVLFGLAEERLNDGRIGLEKMLTLIRDVEPNSPEVPEMLSARLALAEKLDASGLHEAAIAEFRDVVSRHASGVKGPLFERASRGEAAALIASGRHGEASALLGSRDVPDVKDLVEQSRWHLAEASDTPDKTREDAKLFEARALYSEGDMAGSVAAYREHVSGGKALSRADASRYMLASSRDGKIGTGGAPDPVFQDAERKNLMIAAESLNANRKDGPLSTDSAKAILNDAGKTLDASEAIMGGIADLQR